MKTGINIAVISGVLLLFFIFLFSSGNLHAQDLPVKLAELTAPDFIKAVELSGGTCLVPIGVLEKHGPHLPLGTDMLDVREVCMRAAKKEYTIVFPEYYFSQIFEAKHQPGTISYSQKLIWDVLQETCDELARNGIKKIILVNGHGGNNSFLPFFCQSQLEKKKDYAVVLFRPSDNPEIAAKVKALRKTTAGGHADEAETSTMYSHSPGIVHPERANQQSGENMNRLNGFANGYTGIWWYANYPNHYAGDGSHASKEIGDLLINAEADQLAKTVKQLKTDNRIIELQNRFFNESEQPLKTKQ